MDHRITRQMMFMGMARVASMRSTCFRLNVGAIVAHKNNPVSIGWNGQPPGHPHCQGNNCQGRLPGMCNTVHAEVNALNKAVNLLREREKVDLYVTHSPCEACVDSILCLRKIRVERVFFEAPYRNTGHLDRLTAAGMMVYEVTPAGYTVDHFTRKVVELS